MRRARHLLIASAAATALVASAVAQAATPAGGTLSKPKQTLTWTGAFRIGTLEVKCRADAVVRVCDHFKLKVGMGDGSRIRVQLPAPNSATDVDFFVYDPKGAEIARSVNVVGQNESASFTHKAKFRNQAYDIEVVPYLVNPTTTYKATASVAKYVR